MIKGLYLKHFRVLDLFSGIGGFSLGLEMTNKFKTLAFCEKDDKARMVLRKHWKDIPIFKNVTDLSIKEGQFDVICGGFPCQDISNAGLKKGIIKGSRSSLWKEFKRLINEGKPKYVIIENVERLRKNGIGVVLADLAEIGYDAEWHCITARAIGYPHQRDRLWIISYPSSQRLYGHIKQKRFLQINKKWKSKTLHKNWKELQLESSKVRKILSERDIKITEYGNSNKRKNLSQLRRVTDGVPEGLDERRRKERIKQLGNAIVPDMAKMIGNAIIEYETL